MKIGLVGRGGWIGNAFAEYFDWIGIPWTQSWQLSSDKCDVVLNCAGFVGKPNVDACELPENQKQLADSNIHLVDTLGRKCKELEIPLAHISSGCIYNGHAFGGWRETVPPNFSGSAYSRSKILGEKAFTYSGCDGWMFRPRMPFDGTWEPRNLLYKLARYETIVDATNSITHMPSFVANVTRAIVQNVPFGIYNMVNRGMVSNVEIRNRLVEAGLAKPAKVISVESFRGMFEADRSFTILNTDKANDCGIGAGDAMQWIESCIEMMKVDMGLGRIHKTA